MLPAGRGADYERVFNKTYAGSPELNQVKAELAEIDLTKDRLNQELDSRLAYLENRKSRDFFLSIDTAKERISLNFGSDTVRDAAVRIGAPVAFRGPNALGRYIIFLPNDSVIHSPGGPARGPKPGSFMVSEADLAAIWDRITPETRVYIF